MGDDERGSMGDDVRAAWDANARFWDERLSRPDSWQNTLIFPAVERLLVVARGERVLEVACGSGLLIERLVAAGAQVTAFDFSEEMVARARARAGGPDADIRVVDATDDAALRSLGNGFDAVVCSMGLMDMSDIGPLAAALPHLLRPGGRFVFCVTHPAFNGLGLVRVTEQEDRDGELMTTRSVKISAYIHPRHDRGIGIPGQPAPQFYFERPLSLLLGTFLERGLVLDGLEEPVIRPEVAEANDEDPLWSEIPPVLAARLRFPD